MKIILADVNLNIVEAWQEICSELDDVEIYHGSILDIKCDAIVSPANSFGFMDGGLDLRLSYFFGWHVQENLQKIIRTKHHGELLVGMAEIVETEHPQIPYLISAPTMRVPMILGRETVNVYLATRAVLLLIKHGNLTDDLTIADVVQSVAFSGMGTGVGRVPPNICAWQMKQAILDFDKGSYSFPTSWQNAQTEHQKLYSDSTKDLQYR